MTKEEKKKIRSWAIISIISALTSFLIIGIISPVIKELGFDTNDICSDLPNKFEYVVRCVQIPVLIFNIFSTLIVGIFTALSALCIHGVLTYKKTDLIANIIAKISIGINAIYILLIICEIVLLIIAIYGQYILI